MKKIIIVLTAALINFLAANCSAFAEDFYIKKYDVNMEVTEDRVVKINENIDVVFNKRSHGISGNIPYRQEIELPDGSKVLVSAKIRNIQVNTQMGNMQVNEQYKTSIDHDNGNLVLEIGKPNSYVKGEQSYSISYDYYISNYSPNNGFYFNIIGAQWSVKIARANFYIQMPKEFNPDDMEISVGKYGTAGFKGHDAAYSTNGKYIKGYTKRWLKKGEGIVIKILLPDNYFTSKNDGETDSTLMFLFTIAGIIILTATAVAIWHIYGRDDPVTPIVNFYPPKGRNSAEVGVEYRGYATKKEVISLIFYLASKGYLKISGGGTGFTLTKIKEYDGGNPFEQQLMNALFKSGNFVSQGTLARSQIFYTECTRIENSLNKTSNAFFNKNTCSFAKIIISMVCILGIMVLMLFSLFNASLVIVIITAIVGILEMGFSPFWQLMFFVLFVMIYYCWRNNNYSKFISFFLVWLFIAFVCIMCKLASYGIDFQLTFNPAVIFTGITGLVISLICFVNMPKRNKRGRFVLGQLLGFKKFLEVAEKERIESLIKENPNYFYEILAFAYVLDVSDAWIKKFESILQTRNNRSYSNYDFNLNSFCEISGVMESFIPTITNDRKTKVPHPKEADLKQHWRQ